MSEDATEAVTILACVLGGMLMKTFPNIKNKKKAPHSLLYTVFFNYQFDFGLVMILSVLQGIFYPHKCEVQRDFCISTHAAWELLQYKTQSTHGIQ